MAIIIKKISRKTWFSMASFLGLSFALMQRGLLGGSSINLDQLEEKAKKALSCTNSIEFISSANADAPDGTGCSDGACGGDGSGSC
jgi:hypothetical protein